MLVTPEYVFKDVTISRRSGWPKRASGHWCWTSTTPSPPTAVRSCRKMWPCGWTLCAGRGVRLTIVSNGAEKRVRPLPEAGPCVPVPLRKAAALCSDGSAAPHGREAPSDGDGGRPALCRPHGGSAVRHSGLDGGAPRPGPRCAGHPQA